MKAATMVAIVAVELLLSILVALAVGPAAGAVVAWTFAIANVVFGIIIPEIYRLTGR